MAWQQFNPREKLLVGLVLPVVIGFMFYVYLWQPTQVNLHHLRVAVPEQNATLAWMNFRLGDNVNESNVQDDAGNTGPLLTVIEKFAIDNKIKNAIQRVQPGNAGVVEFWFQEVVADQLFAWIEQLASNGITVDSATITRSVPGRVAARIKLIRQ